MIRPNSFSNFQIWASPRLRLIDTPAIRRLQRLWRKTVHLKPNPWQYLAVKPPTCNNRQPSKRQLPRSWDFAKTSNLSRANAHSLNQVEGQTLLAMEPRVLLISSHPWYYQTRRHHQFLIRTSKSPLLTSACPLWIPTRTQSLARTKLSRNHTIQISKWLPPNLSLLTKLWLPKPVQEAKVCVKAVSSNIKHWATYQIRMSSGSSTTLSPCKEYSREIVLMRISATYSSRSLRQRSGSRATTETPHPPNRTIKDSLSHNTRADELQWML